jgi:hypothetical protein
MNQASSVDESEDLIAKGKQREIANAQAEAQENLFIFPFLFVHFFSLVSMALKTHIMHLKCFSPLV